MRPSNQDVTLKASDEKHHALSLSRPETRAIFASAAEARCRAVMLAALTYDERAACGVALVSLGADVLAIMGVLPHGMDPRALAAAYSAPDKWRLWQVEVRRGCLAGTMTCRARTHCRALSPLRAYAACVA